MSRVKNNYSLKIWAIYFTTEGLKPQFLMFSQLKMLKIVLKNLIFTLFYAFD